MYKSSLILSVLKKYKQVLSNYHLQAKEKKTAKLAKRLNKLSEKLYKGELRIF